MTKKEPNIILELSINFSLSLIEFCDELESHRKYSIAGQLFRSGTSIGANVSEAQDCESKADFLHKIKIAAKEARETSYWIYLCNNSKNYPANPKLLDDVNAISRVLTKIITTMRAKLEAEKKKA
jgi:four helix bundle protein